jgi:ubiquinone biosynthesis protein
MRPPLRRWCGWRGSATLTCKNGPAYAGAFRAIGPAAIKLGQTLATRPDLVGEEAARNLLRLQDSLPPVPFAQIARRWRSSFGQPIEKLFSIGRPGARRRGVDRAGPQARSPPMAARSRSRCCARASRAEFARDIDTYEWAAAQVEAMGGEASRLRPRLTIANLQALDQFANSTCGARRHRPPNSPSQMAGEPGLRRIPGDRLGSHQWPGHDARVDQRHQDVEPRAMNCAAGHDFAEKLADTAGDRVPAQAISAVSSMPTCTRATCSWRTTAPSSAIDFGIMGRIDRRARQWLAEILYGLITGNYRASPKSISRRNMCPPPLGRRVRDRAARRGRADARQAGEGT